MEEPLTTLTSSHERGESDCNYFSLRIVLSFISEKVWNFPELYTQKIMEFIPIYI